ncbi:hypothetical protein VIBNIPon4_700030 [Vibrio nigripulchritudo POn4]|nr:hypothetical protein VIBNIPon4_700030 [Vibrio nigripulchritudo POn4]
MTYMSDIPYFLCIIVALQNNGMSYCMFECYHSYKANLCSQGRAIVHY